MTEPGAQEGSDDTPEPTFADVLNNLSLDSGRSRRRRKDKPPAETPDEPPSSPSGMTPEWPLGGGADEAWDPAPAGSEPEDDAAEPDDDAADVRPYTWTQGRTRPVREFALETLVSTSEHGHDVTALASVEHRAVAELCRSPRSVAEIAASLSLPLGVAKVLLADMTRMDLVVVHDTAGTSADAPDRALMERVLSGLRRL